MKIKPILFSTPMVQSILDERKTQTRRIVKPQPDEDGISKHIHSKKWHDTSARVYKPIAQIGDIFWVRETYALIPYEHSQKYHGYCYKADWVNSDLTCPTSKWKPSIFMPKEACRIFLKVTDVRVERLQDISEEDAISEGVEKHSDYGSTGYIHYGEPDAAYTDIDAVWSFETLWESINGSGSWDANPWVWVYELERCEKPKNFI